VEIFSFLGSNFGIYKYLDFFEITVFAILVYKFFIWLSYDKSKKLHLIFLLFTTLFIASSYIGASTLNNFLYVYSPIILLLLIVAHQDILQKNFIIPAKVRAAKVDDSSWVVELIKSYVLGMSKNINLVCVIECSDDLSEFIDKGVDINSLISKNLMSLFFNSFDFNKDKLIYISYTGSLKAINCSVFESDIDNFISIMTNKSDCIFLKSNSVTRTLEVIAQGKYLNDLSSEKALNLLTHYLKKNKFQKEEIINENSSNTNIKQTNY
jgi:hypothetical protein